MALVVKDRVKQTTTTTGTGSIVLNGNIDGFQTFAAALTDGDTTYYGIFVPSTNAFEVGLGTWTEGSATLARTTILESSNSGSAINITAQAEVFITQPAEKAVFQDANGDVDLGGNKILFGNLYSSTGDLPSASTYHGMFAHVHGTGKAYYAHGGNWIELVNEDTSGNVSMGGNLTVTGDLTVNGTTTTVSTTNTVVKDSLIELGNGTSGSPSNDAGIVIERGSSDNAFIGYDESADKFTVGTGSFTGATTGNLTISTGTLVANVEGNVTGNVTGNADTATTAGTVTTAAQSNITSLGTLTTLTVDDITINGSTISDGGDFTVDVGGAITLDADSGYIDFADGGTTIGRIENSSSDFKFEARVQDKDILFVGNDGGSGITALQLDMANAGAATFNAGITTTGIITGGSYNVGGTAVIDSGRNLVNMGNVNGAAGIFGTVTVDDITINDSTISDAGDLIVDVGGNLHLDADGGNITFKDAGTQFGKVRHDGSNNAELYSTGQLHLRANDGTNSQSHYVWNQGNVAPWADSYFDLGTTSYGWKDGYFTGSITVGSNIVHDGDDDTYLQFDAANSFRIIAGNTQTIKTTSSAITMHLDTDIDGSLTADDVYVAGSLIHEGDTDTKISFGTDSVQTYAGNTATWSVYSSYVALQAPIFNYYTYYDESTQLTGTTPTINAANSGNFYLTMSGNTTFTFSDTQTGGSWAHGFTLYLTGNGSTVTWPNDVNWAGGTAPDAPANGEVDVYVFHTRDGENWYGVLSIDAAS